MTDFALELTLHSMAVDTHIDKLARSHDPYLRKKLVDVVKDHLRLHNPQTMNFTIAPDELNRYCRLYGEQYVADACADLTQYFDIVNKRLFSRSVPTQLAVLYLFGPGKQYRPNNAAFSAAGEAVAGFCLEKFGYQALVRPLGIMPDAVCCGIRAGTTHLALVEAKASTVKPVRRLLEENVPDFFVDIKTRAAGFRNAYEGYLVCTKFSDGGKIEALCLYVDLSHYSRGAVDQCPLHITGTIAPPDRPVDRLRDIIRVQAETQATKDEYLTSLLSEEATRSATLALIHEGRVPKGAEEVDRGIWKTAEELRMREQWKAGQGLIKHTKAKEADEISHALVRYHGNELAPD